MRILVNHDGQQLGPYSLDEVRAALQAGSLNATDLAWVEGTPSWVSLASVVSAPAGGPPGFAGATPQGGFQPFVVAQEAPTSGLATTSLVLGILSFFCLGPLMSIPAVICGHIARSNIRNSQGREKGEGLALGGLICGYINIALVPIVVALMFPAFMVGFEGARNGQVLNDARQLALGCQMYANEHGKYPASLEELVPQFVPSITLHRPGSPGFDYLAAGKKDPAPESVILVGKRVNKQGQRVVAHASGDVALEKYDPSTTPEKP